MAKKQRPMGSFSGHETFPFRYTWLTKAVRAVAEDSHVFSSEDAVVRLGVGKNMVKSIRHWALVTGVLQEEAMGPRGRNKVLHVTNLGQRLLGSDGWDPYLELPGTIWLLHWQLCTDAMLATTWYWTFNLLPQPEFTKNELLDWLKNYVEENRWAKTGSGTIKRDIDCMVRTYVPAKVTKKVGIEDTLDSPLVELGLLREVGVRGQFRIVRGDQPTLPDGVFAYALASFLAASGETAKTVPLDKIAFAPGSPGRIFGLSETSMHRRLERLKDLTHGALSYDETAGLRQVLVHNDCSVLDLLEAYYVTQQHAATA
ncbi:MAG: DUF4007 family protein [Planctomycetes bacterium]|nr:DUF4007 family protein [Planctomycetota bacterium]